MATSSKVLVRAVAGTTTATLYTVPALTTTVVTNIVVTNSASSSATFTITLNGVDIFTTCSIAANSTAMFDLKQVIAATQIIAGFASATTVKFHICGVEII